MRKLKQRMFPKKYKLEESVYLDIENRASAAKEFLEEERFDFIRRLLLDNLDYIKQQIWNDTIKDTEEYITYTDRIKRFFTPKKRQISELVGEYKLITKFFSDLQEIVKYKDETDKMISEKEIVMSKDVNE